MDRRHFITKGLVAGVAAAGMTTVTQAAPSKALTILGIACSPRQGKTTATSVGIALEAAKQVHSSISTELIDLGGLTFSGWNGTGQFTEDSFSNHVLPKLKDPSVGGFIIGSPVYFRNMSSLCMSSYTAVSIFSSWFY